VLLLLLLLLLVLLHALQACAPSFLCCVTAAVSVSSFGVEALLEAYLQLFP
jgi:hypothetical protein